MIAQLSKQNYFKTNVHVAWKMFMVWRSW